MTSQGWYVVLSAACKTRVRPLKAWAAGRLWDSL